MAGKAATVEHGVPDQLAHLVPFRAGLARGIMSSVSASGHVNTVDWGTLNRASYALRFQKLRKATDHIERLEAFLYDTALGVRPFWAKEPLSRTHRHLMCGPPADGVRTTFPISCFAPTDVTVFVDGHPQASSDYAIHSAANEVSDNQAVAMDASEGVEALAGTHVVSRTTDNHASGISAYKVVPSGAQSNIGIVIPANASYLIACDPAKVITCFGSAYGAGAWSLRIRCLNAALGTISTTNSAYTGSASEWTHWSNSITTDALTAYVQIWNFRSTSSDGTAYPSHLGMCHGDYDRWHLPSLAPGLIEFSSAPSEGSTVSATATGQKLARVWMVTPGKTADQFFAPGNMAPGKIPVVEQSQGEW